MAVTDPASPSTRVGAKALSARASDEPASAASAAITRTMGICGTRVVSAAPRTRSPLSARAHRITALGEVSVRFLAGPDEVVPIVLVREIATVHVHRDVLVDLVLDRRIEILLRRLVLFQALDAAHIILRRSFRAVVVRRAD